MELGKEYFLRKAVSGQNENNIAGFDIIKEIIENDEFYYEEIEDDEEYEEVSGIFTERLQEFFEVDRED